MNDFPNPQGGKFSRYNNHLSFIFYMLSKRSPFGVMPKAFLRKETDVLERKNSTKDYK